MNWRLGLGDVLNLLAGATAEGDYAGAITGIADLRLAAAGQLSFLGGGKYARYLGDSQASVILVPADQEGAPKSGQVWIRVKDPSKALAEVCALVEQQILCQPEPGIHATALVDPSAEVDSSACIGPYCVIGPRARVGAGAVLDSHVRIGHDVEVGSRSRLQHGVAVEWGCRIGSDCRIYPGAVIGSDGFGYHSDKTGHKRIPQIGIVVVEDDVEIGANSCIDRARFAETRIGTGTRIDNLVQIGHNVIIGKHCILCSEVGISGSSELGDFVILAGQVGVAGHLKIGNRVVATGQTGISKDVPDGTILSGSPARPHREEMKRTVLLNQLPELNQRVKALEAAQPRQE